MAEAVTTHTRLAIVREIQEDSSGAILRFQQGGEARLALGDANYETHLQLARRSRERQHPVGVHFGERQIIAELIRADNDVPAEICEDASGASVFFLGHDGVYHLNADFAEFARLRAVLCEAIQRKARLWFVAQKHDLMLLDILPAGWAAVSSTGDGNGAPQAPN